MPTRIYTNMDVGPAHDRELTKHDWVLYVEGTKRIPATWFHLGNDAGFCENILGIRFAGFATWVSFALEYKRRPPTYSFDILSYLWARRAGKALVKYFGGVRALRELGTFDLLSPEITDALVQESQSAMAITKREEA